MTAPRESARRAVAIALAATLSSVALAAQDSLQLTDGRFVLGQRMSAREGGVVVHYANGDVLVPERMVKATTVNAERRREVERRIAAARSRRGWANRYRKESAHFSFEYTIDPDVMDGYIELMEAYYTTFTKAWRISKPSRLGRLRVCFYQDRERFEQVTGLHGGVRGYFRFLAPHELSLFYNRLDPEQVIGTLFHETNHYLTFLIDPRFRYPRWLNEGLAEYYGASEWDPERKRMEVGGIREGRLAEIRDDIAMGKRARLEDLIRRPELYEKYTWGWSFVHFMMSTKRYAKRFKRFYLALARDRSVQRSDYFHTMRQVEADEQIRVLTKCLRVKRLSDLESEWYDYVDGLSPVSHRGFEEAGMLAADRDMWLQAKKFFDKAIELGSERPVARYRYGRVLMDLHLYPYAATQFRAAIERDPLAGPFYLGLADAKEAMKESEHEVKRLRKLAAEIDPDSWAVRVAMAGR